VHEDGGARGSIGCELLTFPVLGAECGGSADSTGFTEDAGTDSTTGSSSGGSSSSGGPVSCSHPSTSYQMNGSNCGTFRWAVKTGTDDDVSRVNMTPQVTTIATLQKLPTVTGSSCNRVSGEKVIGEIPYPGCAGHDSCQTGNPWLCEITRARAAMDANDPMPTSGIRGTGTVIGAGSSTPTRE
jgi:hypothetical protein